MRRKSWSLRVICTLEIWGGNRKMAPLVFFFWDDLILLNYNVFCTSLSMGTPNTVANQCIGIK